MLKMYVDNMKLSIRLQIKYLGARNKGFCEIPRWPQYVYYTMIFNYLIFLYYIPCFRGAGGCLGFVCLFMSVFVRVFWVFFLQKVG